MTIRQIGGVFGRNPAFNDVQINDLTVEGQLLQTGSENVGLGTGTPSGSGTRKTVHIDGANGAAIRLSDAAGSALLRYNTTGSLDLMSIGATPLGLFTNNVERLNVAAGGDVTVKTGNLVIGTSGKGIDFSATPGTGTSELFDDYEEGTWTPEFSITSGSFSAITYGSRTGGWYTKWGNTVHVSGYISTDSLTVGTDGTLRIDGLPFTSAGTGLPGFSERPPAYIGTAANWGTSTPIGGFVYPSTTLLFLHSRSAVDGASSATLASNMGTTSQDNELAFAATYTVD